MPWLGGRPAPGSDRPPDPPPGSPLRPAGPPPAPAGPIPGHPVRESLVVARMLDGRVIKGRCLDVSPDKPVCHVVTADQGTVKVALAEVKALFFVKSLGGDPAYQEHRTLDHQDPRIRGARVLDVRFKDGEHLLGLAPTYQPGRPFFFVSPVDPGSNNVRVLVNRAAVVSVEPLPPSGRPG